MIKKTSSGGDSIVKWWGVIAILIGAIFSAGIVHFRVNANADEINDHNEGQHLQTRRDMKQLEMRSVRIEERMVHVQENIQRIQTEQRAGFDRLERAVKEK